VQFLDFFIFDSELTVTVAYKFTWNLV